MKNIRNSTSIRSIVRCLLCAAFLAMAVWMMSLATAANPVAGIRLLSQGHVGQDVRVEAIGENLPRSKKHPHRKKKVQLFWKLDRRPMLSTATISEVNSKQTSFRADVPGLYVIRLTVRSGKLRATATLNVTATEPTPLVTVNTIVTSGGTPATVIGSQSPFQDPTNGTGLHVVVVDRNSLELINNTGYQLTSTDIQDMQTYFATTLPQDGSVLVLVSFAAYNGTTIPSSLLPTASPSPTQGPLSTALNKIGGLIPEFWTLGKGNAALQTCWSSMMSQCYNNNAQWEQSNPAWNLQFSVIGVPGMAAGNAWSSDAGQNPVGTLAGYLTPGAAVGGGANSSAYVFVFGADQYVTVDTCASLDTNGNCVINVGGQTFPPKNGVQNGMTVVLLDRVSLQWLVYDTVTSTSELYSNLIYPTYPNLPYWPSGHFFYGPYNANPFTDRTIVILQSVGTGQLAPFSPVQTGDTGTALLQAIDQFGGTPETFGPAIASGSTSATPHPYALVGVAGDLPWHGKAIESSPLISSAQPGRARGVLSRDRYARYTPTTSDPVGTATLDLAPVVYQSPTPWPWAGNCAVMYIAQYLFGANTPYQDFRSAYTVTDINWAFYQPMFVPPPATAPSYCDPFPSDDYPAIQNQLQTEVRLLGNVNLFIQALAQPFVDTGSGQNTISQVAENIYQSVAPSPSASTSTSWSNIFNLASSVAGVFYPDNSSVFGVMASVGTIAVDTMSSSSTANPAKQILAEAVNVSSQLYSQTQAHLATLANLNVILVSDYGKLSAVGNGVTDGTYAWTDTDTTHAIQVLNATTQQSVYSAMLPPVWNLVECKPYLPWLPDPWPVNGASNDCYFSGWYSGAGGCCGCPFWYALDENVFASLFQLVPGGAGETSTTEGWTFDHDFNVDNAYASVPPTSVTGTLFSTGGGGGAAYPPAWYRTTYNPPNFVFCGGGNGGPSCTDQHAMPTIPPTWANYTLN